MGFECDLRKKGKVTFRFVDGTEHRIRKVDVIESELVKQYDKIADKTINKIVNKTIKEIEQKIKSDTTLTDIEKARVIEEQNTERNIEKIKRVHRERIASEWAKTQGEKVWSEILSKAQSFGNKLMEDIQKKAL